MPEIISRRRSIVTAVGSSLGLTLRQELLDMGLDVGSEVEITLANGKKKRIIITSGKNEK